MRSFNHITDNQAGFFIGLKFDLVILLASLAALNPPCFTTRKINNNHQMNAYIMLKTGQRRLYSS